MATTPKAEPPPATGSLPGRWPAVAVCLLLALAVWVVFGQTRHYKFVNYDDPR